MTRTLFSALGATIAACALAAAPAGAAEVGTYTYWDGYSYGPALTFDAAAGETNRLTVTDAASGVTVADAANHVAATDDCAQVDDHTVQCPAARKFELILGDGDDELTLTGRSGLDDADEPLPVAWGGPGADTLRGGPYRDALYGGNDGDTISGGAGSDSLYAGAGEDHVSGGAGDDLMEEGTPGWNGGGEPSPVDPVTEADDFAGGPGGDSLGYWSRTEDLNLTADGVADDGAPGEYDNIAADVDTIQAGRGDDHVELPALAAQADQYGTQGGDGNDTILGSAGDDGIVGGPGNDTIEGRRGRDSISGSGGGDTIDGGPGPDMLIGENGDDKIDARDDSTFLAIGPGDDWVTCGAGEDSYLADFSEIYRLIPGEMGDGCDHHNNPADPTYQIEPAPTGVAGSGELRVDVTCPQSAAGSCGGDVQAVVAPAGAVRAAAAQRGPIVLATGHAEMRVGRTRHAKLALTKEGRRYLRNRDAVTARARARRANTDFARLPGKVRIHVKH